MEVSDRIVYTAHAERKLRERRLSKSAVETTIRNPQTDMEAIFGRRIAQRTVGRKLLRVVYEKDGSVYIVITAYYTEPGRYVWIL